MRPTPYHQNGERLTAHVEVWIRPPEARQHPDEWNGPVKLDTGAQYCHIPDMLAMRLDLMPIGIEYVVGLGGRVIEASVYLVSLEIPHVASYHPTLKVVSTSTDRVVLGMDFLALYQALFDGPGSQYTLTPASPYLVQLQQP